MTIPYFSNGFDILWNTSIFKLAKPIYGNEILILEPSIILVHNAGGNIAFSWNFRLAEARVGMWLYYQLLL